MNEDTLVDGVHCAAIGLDERAFQFGDGLFETLAVVDGEPCLWAAHMTRLATGCSRLGLPTPDPGLLLSESRTLCAGRERAVLKIYWTAGRSARGYRRADPLLPGRMLRISAWPGPRQDRHGWVLRQCSHRLSENPVLAGIKHLNRLDQVIARAEWSDAAIDEGVMLDQHGAVVAGTMSNLFLQHGEALTTPVIDRAGIAGVVRDLALQLAQERGLQVRVARVSLQELRTADALYLSNSLIGIASVQAFEDRVYRQVDAPHSVMAETARRCHRVGSTGDAR